MFKARFTASRRTVRTPSFHLERLESRHLLAAAISVEAFANGQDADSPPGLLADAGASISWTYRVTNPGDAPLSNVALRNDAGTPGNAADDITPSSLAPTLVARGVLEKTFDFGAKKFVLHPTLPYMYATVPGTNSIAVINTDTLVLEKQVFIGSNPYGLAITPDGSRVYVANMGSAVLGVFDTQTSTALPGLALTETAMDVEVGADGRLFVLGTDTLMQISPTTGAKVGVDLKRSVYSGELEISPDKTRLYFADYGMSPASLYQYNVAVDPPVQLWESPHGGTSGSNGQDLNISHDGSFISYPAGSGQIGYSIAKYRTSDMAILGTFDTGAYPREIAFSPDDKLAYTIHTSGKIDLWDTTTFQSLGTINTPSSSTGVELRTDRTGQHLFASIDSKVYVYATGRFAGANIGDLNGNQDLDPGETWLYNSTSVAAFGEQLTTATVTARAPGGTSVTAQDLTYYSTATWQFSVDAAVAGNAANASPGPQLASGSNATWTYLVSNTGTTALSNVVLTDDAGTSGIPGDDITPQFVNGDANSNGLLDPGEAWSFSSSQVVAIGNRVHTAKLSAVPVNGLGEPLAGPSVVTDATHYFGVNSQISIATKVLHQPATAAPGPNVPQGSTVPLQYDLTNTGNVPLTGLQLIDDNGTPLTSDDFTPTSVTFDTPVGFLEAKYSQLKAARFVLHPTLPYLYASIQSTNSIAVINTETLILETQVYIGAGPTNLAINADGTRVYVANSASQFVGVFDTVSRTTLPSLQFAERVLDVEVGAAGSLYVLGESSLRKFDATTGAQIGTALSAFVYSGELAISPQKDRLYYADYGLSPASLYQFDITGETAVKLWESPHGGTSGENGQDLAISADGSFISYAAGYGQVGYSIAKYRTSDMAILGTFNTGAYPREITFSSDGTRAYTVNTSGKIGMWDTTNFLSLGTITTVGEAFELQADRSGNHLFAAFENELRVYSTGAARSYNIGDLNYNGKFDPGETWRYTASRVATGGLHSGTPTAAATDVLNQQVTSTGSTYYFAAGVSIDIQSSVNGQDADVAPGANLVAGQNATWAYRITNTGLVSFSNVVVTDDAGTPADTTDDLRPTFAGGDSNANGLLDVGEVWQYTATMLSVSGARQHIAKVSALPLGFDGEPSPGATPFTGSDATNYSGQIASISVEQTVNGHQADAPLGPEFFVGAPLNWTTRVTNTGTMPLENPVVVSDNGTPAITSDDVSVGAVAGLQASGTLQKTFAGLAGVTKMIMHPTKPLLFATVYDTNRVVAINTATLTVVSSAFIGSGPRDLVLSQDGSRVYVANTSSSFIGVLDVDSLEVLPSIEIPEIVQDLEMGKNGRLFVLGQTAIHQINALTGLSAGPTIDLGVDAISGGEIALSHDRTTLYYADAGRAILSLHKINIAVNPPVVVWKSTTSTDLTGLNLTISHDGNFISGAGGTKYGTASMNVLGKFNPGGAPSEIVFSSDDRFAYVIAGPGKIDIRNTSTFVSVGSILTAGTASELYLDATGQRLFAAFAGELRVYSTRQIVTNTGDVNFNQLLDPGEVWSYLQTGTASVGSHARSVQVTANSAGAAINGNDPAHYFGVTQLIVRANSAGQPIASTGLSATDIYELSDDRFEIIAGDLRLKAGITLAPTVDEPLVVEVRDEATQALLRKYSLNVPEAVAPWQNVQVNADVDADGMVTPSDVLLIINELNSNGARELIAMAFYIDRLFYDVSGDGNLAPLDALLVINRLNAGGAGEAIASDTAVQSSDDEVQASASFDSADDADSGILSMLAEDQLQAAWMWSQAPILPHGYLADADLEESVDTLALAISSSDD